MEAPSLATVIMLLNLIVYNIAITRLLKFTLSTVDFKVALSEKSVATPPVAPNAGMALVQNEQSDPVASYSRVAGAIGGLSTSTSSSTRGR